MMWKKSKGPGKELVPVNPPMDKQTNTMDTDLVWLQGVKIGPKEELVMAMVCLLEHAGAKSEQLQCSYIKSY